jgi:peptidoglycan/LPS O-acetylase OafA/YrhL
MSGLVSIYLDVFRFLAAMGVFLSHADQHSGFAGVLSTISFNHFDHKFVVIFFVISGYVIAASASRPDRTLANYSADRLARLSSVVIPALVLTYCLDAIGSKVSPEIYSFINPHWQSARLLLNLIYCQQLWFLCVNPSSNTPFWSLGYEFWYYVLFGVLIFVRTKWAKILLLLIVSLFIGPKILLLLPAWAVGAMAFHAGKVCQCSYRNSLILFIATGLGTVMALIFEDQLGFSNGKAGLPPLYYSSNFFGDNVFAIVVAAHFFCCALFSRHLTKNLEPYRIVKFVRWMASHTFSLYLYHMPILFFIRAVTKYDPHNPFAVLAAMAAALLTIAGLSKITEERYPALRILLRRGMVTFTDKLRPFAAKRKLAAQPQKT